MSEVSEPEFSVVVEDVPAPAEAGPVSAGKVIHGRLIPAQQQMLLFSAEEWEGFIEEWAHYQKTQYAKVARFSGATDMGIDVAGFVDKSGFAGIWDNYQCKHYDSALTPGVAIPEIAKCLWHAFEGRVAAPRKYYFMAPKDCGMSLKKLLLNAVDLKAKLFEKWNDWCADAITSTQTIKLDGSFREYVEDFDFSIFTFEPALDVLDEHRKTPYYTARFGSGLPDRPKSEAPPEQPAETESRYLRQLMDAYRDHKKSPVADCAALGPWPELVQHYNRQREYFYHAESLRNFARDNVPPGTFEDLQEEVHAGVIEVEASPHPDAFVRVNAVTQAAALLPLSANGLISVTRIPDKRGICHQLANENRLWWVKT